jgi:DNA-directed RNA polymerase specialized sigma24 family protein
MAVRAHTPGTPGFASYVETTMRGAAHRAIGQNTAENETVVLDDSAVWTRESTIHEEVSVVNTSLGLLTKSLTNEQRHLVFLRHVEGYPVSEITTERGAQRSEPAL